MALPSDHDIILALGEDLPIGIWVARAPNGEEVYANKTFATIMGTGLLGVHVHGYAEPYGILTRDKKAYPEARLPFVRALQEGKVVVNDDITIRRPDGTCVDVRTFGRPVINSEGVITHVIVAFFDITREVEAERARAESDQRLHLSQRMEAIGTLAGGIAHDFNNLIFGIKLIASELASSESDPKRKEALELIDDITERSAALTRSLLGFARRGKHRAQTLCLSDIVSSMSELLRRTSTGVELELDLTAEDRGVVSGDQSQLEQVIMNLVGNARDAVGEGGRVMIRTRDQLLATVPQGAIGTASTGPHVVLEISDNGAGIAPEHRDRIFEPYFTTKTKGPDRGTGLGLATVLGIVELHGGSIEVDTSLDGRGTMMRVFLPSSRKPAEPHPSPSPSQIAEGGTGTLLVIDDDAIVRRAVTRALESLGYTTIQATGGAEAIEIYRARGGEIDAVVLDMVMPVMSGKATYLALRDLDPSVSVLLVSGYAVNEEVQQILDLGVNAFLPKPHSIEQLATAVASVLRAAAR
ncbi:MAG: response regulator [Deltaproteobacteria bacterium]|nr:response regulator [Deltaproteobacteria bacterium]